LSNGSAYETIDLSVEDGIATITLDREERLNAFTYRMLEEFVDALDRTDADDEVKAVIITGRGRAFCAGADLGEGGKSFDRGDETFTMPQNSDGGGTLSRRMFDSAKPLIGAINGPAVGIGITMTLPMDVRLCSTTAKIGFVFAKRGLVPEASSSFFLPRVVGISKACEWVFTGRIFDAQEALDAGLVRSVHEPDDLIGAARELAQEMSQNTSRVAVALARRMLWQMLAEGTPGLAHEVDSEALYFLGTSDDVKEGVTSFLEKREANYPMKVSELPDFYARWGSERGGFDPALADSDGDVYVRLRLTDRSVSAGKR
jgi:enoyl-CoA hydratase/carnithine racemase